MRIIIIKKKKRDKIRRKRKRTEKSVALFGAMGFFPQGAMQILVPRLAALVAQTL